MTDYQKKFCFECKYFDLSFGEPDLSDVTPGSPPEIRCYKGQLYKFPDYDFSIKDFRKLIRKARTCKHFELAEEDV